LLSHTIQDSGYSGPMDNTDELLDATTALIPPLLTGLEVMEHAARHLHPPNLAQLAEEILPYREPVKQGLAQFSAAPWPEHLTGFVQQATTSAELLLRSFDEFLSARNQSNAAMAAYRAVGFNTKATESIYPLSAMLPPVSRFFLLPESRDDEKLLARLAQVDPAQPNVGVMHISNAADERGGFSLYVPEYYSGETVPVVFALHGGSGHGRSFLWSWIKAARSRNVIVVSPTSKEGTWSLMGPDVDSENLAAMLAYVQEHWSIDPTRVLLSGMSDGGTFSYVSGLQSTSPFTHLAPSSASFHPMLVEVADAQRLQGLPIYLMHGVLDWMFPVDIARSAEQALSGAGAVVEYREIQDLSHTYPVAENPRILDWLMS